MPFVRPWLSLVVQGVQMTFHYEGTTSSLHRFVLSLKSFPESPLISLGYNAARSIQHRD